MKLGIEYRGVTVPVARLDRHDKRLAREFANQKHARDDLTADLTTIFSNPQVYQMYKQTDLQERAKTPLPNRGVRAVREVIGRISTNRSSG